MVRCAAVAVEATPYSSDVININVVVVTHLIQHLYRTFGKWNRFTRTQDKWQAIRFKKLYRYKFWVYTNKQTFIQTSLKLVLFS